MFNVAGHSLTVQQLHMHRYVALRELDDDLRELSMNRRSMEQRLVQLRGWRLFLDSRPFLEWDPEMARLQAAYQQNWDWWHQLLGTLVDVCPASQFAVATCTALAACLQELAPLTRDVRALRATLLDIFWDNPGVRGGPDDYPESCESPSPPPSPTIIFRTPALQD